MIRLREYTAGIQLHDSFARVYSGVSAAGDAAGDETQARCVVHPWASLQNEPVFQALGAGVPVLHLVHWEGLALKVLEAPGALAVTVARRAANAPPDALPDAPPDSPSDAPPDAPPDKLPARLLRLTSSFHER